MSSTDAAFTTQTEESVKSDEHNEPNTSEQPANGDAANQNNKAIKKVKSKKGKSES